MILIAIAQVLAGLCAGGFTAAGLFAVINSVGVLNRIAYVTNTTKQITLLEDMVVVGAVIGNIWWLSNKKILIGPSVLRILFFCGISLFSGMYIGLFLVCLAEAMKSLPLFLRKIRISKAIGLLVLCIAIGKCIGELVYFLILY